MVFSSGVFLLLFLPLTLLIYYNPIIKNRTFKNICLFAASLFFYAWGEPKFVFVMLFSIVVNWGLTLLLDKWRGSYAGKFIFAVLMVLDIGVLFIYKYLNFTVENLNRIPFIEICVQDILLPIGISFYTFQIMSYVVDVYRGSTVRHAASSFLDVALYIAMFPQMIAGPIVRYSTICREITNRSENWQDFTSGIRRFVYGLGKKVILADLLASIADEVFLMVDITGGLTVLSAWLGAIAYMLQIYFDFSGYSDMAIGLGKCFGFHFKENFNYPYSARSISEFWKKWHISLTDWFREYVYIPLGGSRCSIGRNVLNLFIVWLLTGIWHGADWTFILWGLIYFCLQLFEKRLLRNKTLGIFGHVYTLFCVMICWIIFRSESVSQAFSYIRVIIGIKAELYDSAALRMLQGSWILFVTAIASCIPWKNVLMKNMVSSGSMLKIVGSVIKQTAVIVIFITALLMVINGNYSPFVYFNF